MKSFDFHGSKGWEPWVTCRTPCSTFGPKCIITQSYYNVPFTYRAFACFKMYNPELAIHDIGTLCKICSGNRQHLLQLCDVPFFSSIDGHFHVLGTSLQWSHGDITTKWDYDVFFVFLGWISVTGNVCVKFNFSSYEWLIFTQIHDGPHKW